MYRERRSFAPVKVGDEADVTIESVGAQGDGVAKVKGFVIFVPGTKKDDKVKIKITKVFKKVGFGEVVGESSGSPQETSGQDYDSDNSSDETSDNSSDETSDEDSSEEFEEE